MLSRDRPTAVLPDLVRQGVLELQAGGSSARADVPVPYQLQLHLDGALLPQPVLGLPPQRDLLEEDRPQVLVALPRSRNAISLLFQFAFCLELPVTVIYWTALYAP